MASRVAAEGAAANWVAAESALAAAASRMLRAARPARRTAHAGTRGRHRCAPGTKGAAPGFCAPAVQRRRTDLRRGTGAVSDPAAGAAVRLRARRAPVSAPGPGCAQPALHRRAAGSSGLQSRQRRQPLGGRDARRRRRFPPRSACTRRGTAWRRVRCRCGSRSAWRRAACASTPARYSVDRCWLMLGCVVSISASSCETFFSCPHSELMIFSRIGVDEQAEQFGCRWRRPRRIRPGLPSSASCGIGVGLLARRCVIAARPGSAPAEAVVVALQHRGDGGHVFGEQAQVELGAAVVDHAAQRAGRVDAALGPVDRRAVAAHLARRGRRCSGCRGSASRPVPGRHRGSWCSAPAVRLRRQALPAGQQTRAPAASVRRASRLQVRFERIVLSASLQQFEHVVLEHLAGDHLLQAAPAIDRDGQRNDAARRQRRGHRRVSSVIGKCSPAAPRSGAPRRCRARAPRPAPPAAARRQPVAAFRHAGCGGGRTGRWSTRTPPPRACPAACAASKRPPSSSADLGPRHGLARRCRRGRAARPRSAEAAAGDSGR